MKAYSDNCTCMRPEEQSYGIRQLGIGKPVGGFFLPNNASQGSHLPGLVEKGGRN